MCAAKRCTAKFIQSVLQDFSGAEILTSRISKVVKFIVLFGFLSEYFAGNKLKFGEMASGSFVVGQYIRVNPNRTVRPF